LFRAADYDALDRLPRLHIGELALALEAFAGQRPYWSIPDNRKEAISPLGIPTSLEPPAGEPYLYDLGIGLKYGDRMDPAKAKRFHDSERVAMLLDRLARNETRENAPIFSVRIESKTATSPASLATILAGSGHTIEVIDERFAANFGDIEKDLEPVATPLWVGTGWTLANGKELDVPAVHAQLRLQIRGPVVNADVTLFNSLDILGSGGGGTLFRADVTKDQPWVGNRVAHRYEGQQAIRAVRVMGLLRRAAAEKVAEHKLPLEGYFALGVCTLAPALVELDLTGKTTLWPMTHDPKLFDGDSEIDRLVRGLPADLGAPKPDKERLFGSIPWTRLEDVPFPHLQAALKELGFPNTGS